MLKERIIISNSFNEAEFLRCLSKNGFNTFGLRVLNDLELCSYILIKNGQTLSGRFIPDKEAAFIYFSFLKGLYSDSLNICKAINTFSDCVVGEALDEMKDILSDGFMKKKTTIIDAYTKYTEYKKWNNLYDKHDMMNYIISNNLKVDDIEVIYFSEFEITKLMSVMINNVFSNVKEETIKSFYKKNSNHKEIIKCYGKKNEVDFIFNKINNDKLKLDECQIVLMDNEYINEVLVYLRKFNIPYTSTIDNLLIEVNSGKLLKDLIDLKKSNYSLDEYKKLFNSSFFNKKEIEKLLSKDEELNSKDYNNFIKYVGWLRLRFNEDIEISNLYEENMYKALNSFKEDINKGILYFIKKYSKDDINNVCVTTLIEELFTYKNRYKINVDDFDLLEAILNETLHGKTSEESKIHVSGLDKAFSSLRKYNFIIGLDDSYPGSPTENYLIYDDEYRDTGSNLYLSTNIILSKINKLKAFISSCEYAYISYSFYDLLDLKDKNPSSIIYDELSNNTSITTYGFTDSNLSENKDVILSKVNNNISKVNELNYKDIKIDSKSLLNKIYSPSSIRSFYDNKLAFILSNFLNISIDDKDDLYQVMPSNEKGTIIHKLMEKFNKKNISKEEFINKASNEYDKFIKMRPVVINNQMAKDKSDFLSDIGNLYDSDPGNEAIYSEEDLCGKVGNIKFFARFDRIEKTKDNEYILVDYKTGKTLAHESENVKSCIQGLIYACLAEDKYKIKIDRVEFRYSHLKQTPSIIYDEVTKEEMMDLVNEFEKAILNNDFYCPDDLSSYSFIDKYKVLLSLIEEVNKNEDSNSNR